MIPFDFAYYRPTSVRAATEQYQNCAARPHGQPLWYAGGTEIITLARLHQVSTDAVIDIKGIPSTRLIRVKKGVQRIGSAVTLTELTDDPRVVEAFPLLAATAREIADKTARNKITFGGNICGQIIYREAVLPLLVCDSTVFVAGPRGVQQASIHEIFRERIRLRPGEFVLGVQTSAALRQAPHVHIKRRKMGHVGYPIVTIAALSSQHRIRVAVSGVCAFPFRSAALEAALNTPGVPAALRVQRASRQLPGPVLDDFEASRAYRMFVLEQLLQEALERLE